MPALSKNNKIIVSEFKNRIKEVVDNLLPPEASSWDSDNCPDSQMQFMLCKRADIYNAACAVVDNDTTILSDFNITAIPVFELLKNVFPILGRCRKIYYQNGQSYPGPGTQVGPSQIADDVGATSGTDGTFAYFKDSFALSGNYASPAPVWNANTSVTGFKTFPEWGTNNWNTNTKRETNTPKIESMSINNIIYALENVEQQMTNFKNEWTNRSSMSGWWSGSSSDTSNSSNRIFFVRYWCHTNCHDNCHSHRSRR